MSKKFLTGSPREKERKVRAKGAIILFSFIGVSLILSMLYAYSTDKPKSDDTKKKNVNELFSVLPKAEDLTERIETEDIRSQKAMQDSLKDVIATINELKLSNLEKEQKIKLLQLEIDNIEKSRDTVVSEPAVTTTEIVETTSIPGFSYKAPPRDINPENLRGKVPPPPRNPFAIHENPTNEENFDDTPPSFNQIKNTSLSEEVIDKQKEEQKEEFVDLKEGFFIFNGEGERKAVLYQEQVAEIKKETAGKKRGCLPVASSAEVVILTGLDAGASSESQNDPQPVVLRVQSDATIASIDGKGFYSLKGCKIIASAYGEISSGRVMIQPTRISCVDLSNKRMVEAKINAFITDFDGVSGVRGKVEHNDDALIAKSVILSTVAGISNSVSSSTTLIPNIASGMPSSAVVENSLSSSLSKGVSSGLDVIVERQAKELDNIFPVIYLTPGRKGTIKFTESVCLQWESIQ